MDIRGLGYVTLLSSDLAQWRQYASQVLGMMVVGSDDDERLLALGAGPDLGQLLVGLHLGVGRLGDGGPRAGEHLPR